MRLHKQIRLYLKINIMKAIIIYIGNVHVNLHEEFVLPARLIVRTDQN